MNGELADIPSNSLIEMLFVILTRKFAPTTCDGAEIEQIQRELDRRGEFRDLSFATVN